MKTEILKLSTSRGATTAHVARPDHETSTAIILIQEWWGINDHIRDIAGRYAAEGFVCVAPDLYRGKLAKTTAEASALMHDLAIADGIETISAALAETKTKYNAGRFGITGYCMGGTFALRAA
ncbi:MAG TPA: dienelactone hydrolase family protein, partial [Pyrinomonadaceae bacterium]|nr:dienelactone hydrolase family protein [Pyrinomonadaceae bacterium]